MVEECWTVMHEGYEVPAVREVRFSQKEFFAKGSIRLEF